MARRQAAAARRGAKTSQATSHPSRSRSGRREAHRKSAGKRRPGAHGAQGPHQLLKRLPPDAKLEELRRRNAAQLEEERTFWTVTPWPPTGGAPRWDVTRKGRLEVTKKATIHWYEMARELVTRSGGTNYDCSCGLADADCLHVRLVREQYPPPRPAARTDSGRPAAAGGGGHRGFPLH